MSKARFKFNSGMGALLCSRCNVILKTLDNMTSKEIDAYDGKVHLEPQYCDKCVEVRKNNVKKNKNK